MRFLIKKFTVYLSVICLCLWLSISGLLIQDVTGLAPTEGYNELVGTIPIRRLGHHHGKPVLSAAVHSPPPQGVARQYLVPVPIYSQEPENLGDAQTETTIEQTIIDTSKPKYVKRDIIITTEPFYTCPNGFNFEVPSNDGTSTNPQQKCFRIEVTEFVLGCPNGWAFTGVKCSGILTSDAQQACDEGFDILISDENIQCIQKLSAPKMVSCLENYLLINNECALPLHSPPDFICPEGFIPLSNGQCQKDIKFPATLECPTGYLLINGKCERRIDTSILQIQRSCPLGFNIDAAGHCIKQVSVNAKMVCPEGFNKVPQSSNTVDCVKFTIVPATAKCLHGYESDGKQCIRKSSMNPEITCENLDFKLDEYGECINHTTIPAKVECPKKKDYVYNQQTGLCHLSSNHHLQSKHDKTAPPIILCPPGGILQNNEKCLLVNKMKPKIHCKDNGWIYDLNSKKCIYEEYSSIQYDCPFNSQPISNEKCKVMETERLVIECPPEFIYDGQKLCVKKVEADPQIKCPDGLSVTPQGTCLKIEIISPKLICPSGLKPLQSLSDQIPMCTGKELVPKQETCPKNYELVTASDTGQRRCRTYTKTEPIISCADGFIEDGYGCSKTLSTVPRLLCPEDFVLQYSRCIQHIEDMPNKMCPAGFELEEDQCKQIVYTKPLPNCPDGYNYDNIVKRCFKVDMQYDFSSIETTIYQQNYTSTRNKTSSTQPSLPEPLPNSDDPSKLPPSSPQSQPPPVQVPSQGMYVRAPPPYPQSNTLYPPPIQYPRQYPPPSQIAGYPGPNIQFSGRSAGYGYPFPGFQQYAPTPGYSSGSYPVYMRTLKEDEL
ncbi:hypothetical protein cand_010530 [Cryptosporidium andersoni]|uniref:Oocyst wall protein n=1 Tax=Cryptosporidium andersoni TaxID=117008 RepID=A0A1J4MQF3_9CRYT|nr:hypothetical protein cand_010530 [Cryptosporidium andersoni]